MSSSRKITLFLICSISLILIFFGGSVYYFQANYSYTDFYRRLATRVGLLEKYYFESNISDARALKKMRNEHLEKLSEEREYIVDIANLESIERLAEINHLPNEFLELVLHEGKATFQKEDMFFYGEKQTKPKGTYLIAISAKNYYASHHLILLRNVLLGGGIISMFIIIYLSYFFSRRIFHPLETIITRVNNIGTDNIHLRLDEVKDSSEISKLAVTFNNLLSRVEIAFSANKNFISNASHEFGTPLTTIIGEADVALMKDRTAMEYKDALQRILAQAERLNKVSQSLLFLAQTGYKENRLAFTVIRSDELIIQCKEVMNELLPTNNIEIDFNLLPENPTKLKIKGNKELLLLAFTNVLSNACKYSSNKPVSVSLAATNSEVIFIIKDQGIGIPESEMQFIYDPFYRATNTSAYEGYGIGLPLTRNIITIHNGRLTINSILQKGVTVQINLPMADS